MSLFFRKSAAAVEQRSNGWDDFVHGGPVTQVSSSRAAHLAPVYAAWRHIVDYVASTPVDPYREKQDRTRVPAAMPQLLARLDSPSGIGISNWLAQAAYGIAAHGNAVGVINDMDGNGNVTGVRWLRSYEWFMDEYSDKWYVDGALFPRSMLVHIPWIVPPGFTLGLAPLDHYAATIGAGLSAQEYSDIKRGGGLPPSILKNTMQLVDSDNAKAMEARLVDRFSKGRPFVHGRDWEFQAVTIPPNHAQFIETMKLTTTQIAGAYGLDPVDIGGEPAHTMTYNNEETRQIKRAANMRPYLIRIEQGISRLLADKTHIAFDIDATLRVDTATRTDIIGAQIADGRLSVDEARAMEDRTPVPGGDHYNIGGPTVQAKAPIGPVNGKGPKSTGEGGSN